MGSERGAVLVHPPAGSTAMAPCGKIVLLVLLAEGALGARRLRNNAQRDQRSLTNTFPFNAKEQCTLEPQRTCKHVTKLVPKLEPTEECVDVPKEVCTRSRTNPRKVQKPVITKWCYIPSEESGLA